MNKNNRIKEGSTVATVILYAIVVLIIFITVYPMYYVLIMSLSSGKAAASMQVYLWPVEFNIDSYKMLFGDMDMWRAYGNTIIYAVANTVLMLITSVLVAYPLSCKNLMGRKYLNMFLLIPMYFSGGMIPSFLVVSKLGLYNSPWSQILPGCFSIWNIILTKSFMSSLPDGLRESARIDGAGVVQILTRIILPLSKPILAVLAVYTIVGVWNSWFSALIYLPDTDMQPLQMFLRRVLVENSRQVTESLDPDTMRQYITRQMNSSTLKYAMIIYATLPILCVYPFFQKYFVKGVMLGSLKE